MDLARIQAALQTEGIDCWLIYDFQGMNPIMAQFLPGQLMLTRRVFLIIPAAGEPVIVGSKIDNDALRSLAYRPEFYVSWEEMERLLATILADFAVVGLDYSPRGMLPTMSRIDAGTVEMLQQGLGKTVVSAANVFQAAVAAWDEAVLEAHLEDCVTVAQIKDDAFVFIADRLRTGQTVTEYDVQQAIMRRFEAAKLDPDHPPIVAVNSHSGDPHYAPNAEKHWPINHGDWILIDLWARRPGRQFVFADMTWVAVAASQPSPQQQEIFEVVAQARDKTVAYVQQCVDQQLVVEGWQVDDIARNCIAEAGYGDYFFHRTGHSLSPGHHIHGTGVNIDNLETRDTRRLMPGIGFTIWTFDNVNPSQQTSS